MQLFELFGLCYVFCGDQYSVFAFGKINVQAFLSVFLITQFGLSTNKTLEVLAKFASQQTSSFQYVYLCDHIN